MPEIIDWLIISFYFTVNPRRCCTDPLFSHQHSWYVHSQMCLLSYSYNDAVRCFVNQGDVFSYDTGYVYRYTLLRNYPSDGTPWTALPNRKAIIGTYTSCSSMTLAISDCWKELCKISWVQLKVVFLLTHLCPSLIEHQDMGVKLHPQAQQVCTDDGIRIAVVLQEYIHSTFPIFEKMVICVYYMKTLGGESVLFVL